MITESGPVLQPVSNRIGMPLGELRKAMSAEVVGRSNVLRLTVGDRDQTRAITLIQLITEEYLRTTAAAGPTAAAGADKNPLTRPTLLSPASPTPQPLQPRPMRAVAGGVLLGVIAAFAAVTLLVRPRLLFHPSDYWK
jgi:non-specific protein-tyrosine kinase